MVIENNNIISVHHRVRLGIQGQTDNRLGKINISPCLLVANMKSQFK